MPLPSELSDNQEASQRGGETDGGEEDAPMMATPQKPPVPGERQPIRHDHPENRPVSTIKGYTGVLAERRTSNNNARVQSTERAGAKTLANNGSGQPDDASVPHDIAVVRGTCGMRRGAALESPPPGDALAAEAGRRPPLSDQMAREVPQQQPELLPEELSPRTARAEICKLGRDLAESRAAADAATESRRTAEGRVGELEEVIAESERQHALFRERGEARLEILKLAFAQEQEEGGAHVRGPSFVCVDRNPALLCAHGDSCSLPLIESSKNQVV